MSTTPRERPIIFSASSVRAIRDGRKTQTRRAVKNPRGSPVNIHNAEWVEQYANALGFTGCWSFYREIDKTHPRYGQRLACNRIAIDTIRCPYGQPGDRLWVRETWAKRADGMIAYQAGPYPYDVKHELVKWRPSIYMPRWASRITLELTEVRVQRLNEITEEDAIAEGFAASANFSAVQHFARTWDHIYARRGYPWDSNCWVWALSFRRIES